MSDINEGNNLSEFEDFDLDSIPDLDEVDLTGFGEVDSEINLPHLKVNTKALAEFARLAKLFSASSGRDIISKSVSLHVENGKLVCRCTDCDAYLQQELEVLNQANVYDGHLCIPIDILQKYIQASSATTVILVTDEGPKMRVLGGDCPIETYNIDISKYTYADNYELGASLDSESIISIIKAFSPIAVGAVAPAERRIAFTDDSAYASYMWSAIRAKGNFFPFELKVKDLNILKTLLANSDGVVNVGKTGADVKVPRVIVKTDTFVYATLAGNNPIGETIVESMNGFEDKPGVFVDFLTLYKVVNLCADLPSSVGKIILQTTEDGIRASFHNKGKEDSVFNLTGTGDGTKEVSAEVQLQAKLFRILLRSFSSAPSVKLVITDKGVGVQTDTFHATCFQEN